MVNYRDYGAIEGSIAPNVLVNKTHYSQVYTATHDGAGNRLPYMRRAFISFTWGEKSIEDFNLLAIIENNSLQRKLYADFNDNVTESNVWDGQIYWSTHFNANNISFALFTDGITEYQLNEFKHYFQPGRIEELSLSENPNRAIGARISEPPEYSMLPFEERITTMIAGNEYETSTTMYKGSISIKFVMDDPFWYSKIAILDKLKPDGTYDSGKWVDANGNDSRILSDEDAIKIITEDGVPTSMMLRNLALEDLTVESPILFGADTAFMLDLSTSATGSRVGSAVVGRGHVAFVLIGTDLSISVPEVSFISDDESIEDIVRNPGYFYYAGTAPCAPILRFSLTPAVSNEGYITSPCNSYSSLTGKSFNTIIIQSTTKKRFTFTTPGIYTGYNQAIEVFKNSGLIGAAWEEVRVALRDKVKHWAPRAYAIAVVNRVKEGTQTTAALLNECVTEMYNFLLNDSDVIPSAEYIFNCKTGQATAIITYRNASNIVTESEENVGDMVRSNYLIIEDRNYPTEDGYIEKWTPEHPQYSHRIYSDIILSNVNLYYKYQYL